MKINATDLAHIAEGVEAIEAHAQQYFELIDGALALTMTIESGDIQINVGWVNRTLQPLEIVEKEKAS